MRALAVVLIAVAACSSSPGPAHTSLGSGPTTATAPPPNPCNGVGMQALSLAAPPSLVMPTEFSVSTQQNADCMAWQEFLYLNWRADPANPGSPDPSQPVSAYGTAGDQNPTVWESFATPEDVFAAASPVPWRAVRPARKELLRTTKVGDAELELDSITQALTDGWLTDQSGNLVFYEIHLNQDEYNYIVGNTLTTFAGQAACASQSGANATGFNLPGGPGAPGEGFGDTNCAGTPATYGSVGAIELKASWRVLPSDHSLDYRYKTAAATLHLPGGATQPATVGLVGLHIIHKVPLAQQFVWATFEQIDNSPDNGGTAPVLPQGAPALAPYTFYNPSCVPSKDTVYQCQTNDTLAKAGTTLPACPQGSYTPGQCYPYWAPMQVVRMAPVVSDANAVTAYAWSLMPSQSVFHYYRLIDVQWPSTPAVLPPGQRVPSPAGGIQPASNQRIVANTTLETFVQTQDSCMDCHQFASVGQPAAQTLLRTSRTTAPLRRVLIAPHAAGSAAYASDYSFLFSTETTH